MKKFILVFILAITTIAGIAQTFPDKPNKLVNDYTGTLTAAQTQQLEDKLVAFDDSTSIQIAVVILKSVGEYDINEYTLGLGRKWGVGAKKNTGIVLLVALGDRKVSLQTGYGVEGALPDMYTKQIIENNIKPYFKTGDYYGGIESGTNAIISYTKGEYKNDAPKKRQNEGNGSALPILIIIIVIVIILIKRGGGGGSQVIGGRGVANALFWSMLFGGGGGGRGSGGDWGGGSGGGGGFGGFGGGSFGGGGSSGSW